MTPEKEKESLKVWKEGLWGMWQDGMRLGRRPMNMTTMQAAFYSAFDSGRDSLRIIARPRKSKEGK